MTSYHSDEPIATFLRARSDRLLILMPDLALWLPALVGR
jgi:hypothetical protein